MDSPKLQNFNSKRGQQSPQSLYLIRWNFPMFLRYCLPQGLLIFHFQVIQEFPLQSAVRLGLFYHTKQLWLSGTGLPRS